jgi:hypothetical protein
MLGRDSSKARSQADRNEVGRIIVEILPVKDRNRRYSKVILGKGENDGIWDNLKGR